MTLIWSLRPSFPNSILLRMMRLSVSTSLRRMLIANTSTRSRYPLNSPKHRRLWNRRFPTGALTLRMYSPKQPTMFFLPTDLMTILLTLSLRLFPRSLKSTLLTQRSKRRVKHLSMNTSRPDELFHPNHHKLLPSSLSQRRSVHFTPAKTIDT